MMGEYFNAAELVGYVLKNDNFSYYLIRVLILYSHIFMIPCYNIGHFIQRYVDFVPPNC